MPKKLYQHLVAPGFGEGLDTRSADELRSMRAECEQAEAAISFSRRALHGRLDIVHAELRRRAEGGPNPLLDDLVAQLPRILAETQPVGASPRLLPTLEPSSGQDELQEQMMEFIDDVVGPNALTHLPQLDGHALGRCVAELSRLEAELSVARRQLHQQIDVLQGELSSRYGRGELSVEALLT